MLALSPDAPMFSPPPSVGASSHTSYDVSIRSGSPAPSVWSMTSSIRAQAFKHEFGRGLNNYSEVYRLPADDEELDRLEKQHLMFKDLMGNYPPPMLEIMAEDTPGETKTCLDLGCGSGSWILDCRTRFSSLPSCGRSILSQCSRLLAQCPRIAGVLFRSEVDDINLGLEHFYGDFDVVHSQLISSGIKDFYTLIDHISRVLRPGGLAIIIEWDFHAYDHNYQRIEIGTHELRAPWWPRWLAFAKLAIQNSGGSVDAATNLRSWVTDHPAFEDHVYQDFWVPTSHWAHHDPFKLRIGSTMRDDILAFLESGRPLLLGSGVPEDVVDELQRNATAELKKATFPHYIRLQHIYARKRHL
ncbi:S-adenosyl-L-methionine-dependent methyltransferase [Lyophyllum atratum]|nr:S-adenosyl-L-methionine-dependent methyltransferase [Lyophyllum atratum]